MPPAPGALYDLAYDLLSAATTLLGADAPDTRYVACPLPARDCPEQLTVHSDSIVKELVVAEGTLSLYSSVGGPSQNSYGLIVSCTRCTPEPKDPAAPPVPALNAVAER